MRLYTVSYQIGTYSGTVEVTADENAENDQIIAKAKRILRQRAGGSLPFGAESWRIEESTC